MPSSKNSPCAHGNIAVIVIYTEDYKPAYLEMGEL